MITLGLESSVEHILTEVIYAAVSDEKPTKEIIAERKKEMLSLIKAEAINLADHIIGKDRVIHSETDLQQGIEVINRADKAVFDFQVKQRIELAKYQNPGQVVPTVSLTNKELSPNEE